MSHYDYDYDYEDIEERLVNNLKPNYKKYSKTNYDTSHLYDMPKKQFHNLDKRINRKLRGLANEYENYNKDNDDDDNDNNNNEILREIGSNYVNTTKLRKKLYNRSGWIHVPTYYYMNYGIKKCKTYKHFNILERKIK